MASGDCPLTLLSYTTLTFHVLSSCCKVRYGDQLAGIMREMLMVSEVGMLSQGIEAGLSAKALGFHEPTVSFGIPPGIDETASKRSEDSITLINVSSSETYVENQGVIDTDDRYGTTGSLKSTQRIKIRDLLGDFEEPERERTKTVRDMHGHKDTATRYSQFQSHYFVDQGITPFCPTIPTSAPIDRRRLSILESFWFGRYARKLYRIFSESLHASCL